jgi:hypothetical protein
MEVLNRKLVLVAVLGFVVCPTSSVKVRRLGRDVNVIMTAEHAVQNLSSEPHAPRCSELSPGAQVGQYIVETCLGEGVYGEVWTLRGSQHVLKLYPEVEEIAEIREACVFGQIASQKDPEHFVNCTSVGTSRPYVYSIWERADGNHWPYYTFPSLRACLSRLVQLFDALDSLQKVGHVAPGTGVRQWHRDAHMGNIMLSESSLKLIDYGRNDGFEKESFECASIDSSSCGGGAVRCCAESFECTSIPPSLDNWALVAERVVHLVSKSGFQRRHSGFSVTMWMRRLIVLSDGLTVSEIRSLPDHDPGQVLSTLFDAGNSPQAIAAMREQRELFVSNWHNIHAELHGPCAVLLGNDKEQTLIKEHSMALVSAFAHSVVPWDHARPPSFGFDLPSHLEDLMKQFKAKLRPVYREQWNSRCDAMLGAMMSEGMEEGRHEWPPRYIEQVHLALSSL